MWGGGGSAPLLSFCSLTCAVIRDVGEVGAGVERDGLVARVVTRHVTLATVDTHVLEIDHRHPGRVYLPC